MFEDFNFHKIEENNSTSISINIFQFSMMVFRMAISDFSIFSKFPEYIILASSILFNLKENKEIDVFMKLCKGFPKDIEEIAECLEKIEQLIKNNEDIEDEELNFHKNSKFSQFFEVENNAIYNSENNDDIKDTKSFYNFEEKKISDMIIQTPEIFNISGKLIKHETEKYVNFENNQSINSKSEEVKISNENNMQVEIINFNDINDNI